MYTDVCTLSILFAIPPLDAAGELSDRLPFLFATQIVVWFFLLVLRRPNVHQCLAQALGALLVVVGCFVGNRGTIDTINKPWVITRNGTNRILHQGTQSTGIKAWKSASPSFPIEWRRGTMFSFPKKSGMVLFSATTVFGRNRPTSATYLLEPNSRQQCFNS